MNQKNSTEAILTLMQDAQSFKRVYGWKKTTVVLNSDCIETEFRTTGTIHAIPESHADEWRMFASNDEIVFVFTYYYDDEQ